MSEEANEVEVYQPANLFQTNDPGEHIRRATAVADELKDVIAKRKLFNTIRGKAHVRVEGWQLLGSMLGVTAVCVGTEEVENGYKATVEARRVFDGQVIGRADALCTRTERSGPWKSADDYALISMAQTRATSKALKGPLGFVITLAGYEATPAEEMTFAEAETVEPKKPKQPKPCSEELARETAAVVGTNDKLDKLQLAIGHVVGVKVEREFESTDDAEAEFMTMTADQVERIQEWAKK